MCWKSCLFVVQKNIIFFIPTDSCDYDFEIIFISRVFPNFQNYVAFEYYIPPRIHFSFQILIFQGIIKLSKKRILGALRINSLKTQNLKKKILGVVERIFENNISKYCDSLRQIQLIRREIFIFSKNHRCTTLSRVYFTINVNIEICKR